MVDARFSFDRYTSDVCTGAFVIDDGLLRDVLSSIGKLYGLRFIDRDGRTMDVGINDPKRRSFEAACRRYGTGRIQLREFESLMPKGCGVAVNSPQDPNALTGNGFNELSHRFVEKLRFPKNGFPETVDMNLFLGSYEQGFGLHRDCSDAALFVLDGTKHFRVLDGKLTYDLTVCTGQYLRWRSVHWHGNVNPANEWSMTMNFALGPAGSRHVAPGTPVEYSFSETRLNNYLEQLLSHVAPPGEPLP